MRNLQTPYLHRRHTPFADLPGLVNTAGVGVPGAREHESKGVRRRVEGSRTGTPKVVRNRVKNQEQTKYVASGLRHGRPGVKVVQVEFVHSDENH